MAFKNISWQRNQFTDVRIVNIRKQTVFRNQMVSIQFKRPWSSWYDTGAPLEGLLEFCGVCSMLRLKKMALLLTLFQLTLLLISCKPFDYNFVHVIYVLQVHEAVCRFCLQVQVVYTRGLLYMNFFMLSDYGTNNQGIFLTLINFYQLKYIVQYRSFSASPGINKTA